MAIVDSIKKSYTVCVFVLPEGELSYFNNHMLVSTKNLTTLKIIKRVSRGSGKLICWVISGPFDFQRLNFIDYNYIVFMRRTDC